MVAAAPLIAKPTDRGVVLLIEDDEQLQRMYAYHLEGCGFHVVAAGALHPALDLIANGLSPHAVVCDLVLPNGMGLDVVRALLTVTGRWPIVVVTGQYDDSWSMEAYGISPRVQQYILKTRISMVDSGSGVSLGKLVQDAIARSAAVTRAMSAATAHATYTATPLGLSLPRRIAYRMTRSLRRKWSPFEIGLGAASAACVAGGSALAKWPHLTDVLQPVTLGGLIAAIGGGVATFLVARRAQKDE